jgi:hypothetical protein
LTFDVRTEELKSGGTPILQVLDAADGTTILAATPALPNGTRDWQKVSLDFKAPANSEAVIVRVSRASCGSDSVCPIFGLVWYDDFNLQRAAGGAAAAARDDAAAAKPAARGSGAR